MINKKSSIRICNPLLIAILSLMFSSFFSKQTTAQVLSPSVFEFGKVKLWNNPHAFFTFTNNTSKRMLFLPVQYQNNIRVKLPEGYIQPGEQVQIEVVFYTEERGNFSVVQPIYVSGSPEPLDLRLSGKIQSFHPDALTVCPPVDHKTDPLTLPGTATITVYDKKTGQVINGVDILLIGGASNYFMEHTRKLKIPLKGVPTGLYQMDISKPGYFPLQHIQYINTNTGDLIFELEPNPKEPVSAPPSSNTSSGTEDKILEINKVEETDQDAIERIRKMMDERFKNRSRIIEKDVVVVKEGDTLRTPPGTIITSMDSVQKPKVPLKDFDESGRLNPDKYASNNVVFLIDVSGSMKIDDKLETLKTSMKSLVEVLRKQDLVTIVIYSTKARIVLTSTPGDQKEAINSVIDGLRANGSSYGSEGLDMAYEYARQNFIPNGNNQVILASDGLFNSRNVTDKDIYDKAATQVTQRISTSVVCFGRKDEAQIFMQNLASSGNGNFIQIKDAQEAQSALVAEIMHNASKR